MANKTRTLKRHSLIIDLSLVFLILAIFWMIIVDSKKSLLIQKELEHRRLIVSMNEVIDSFIIREIGQVQIALPYLEHASLQTDEDQSAFRKLASLEAVFSVDSNALVKKVFFNKYGKKYVESIDLSSSKINGYILEAINSKLRVITPIYVSVISGKEVFGFLFPSKTGVLIAEVDVNGLFTIIDQTGLLNLYESVIFLLLKPDSNEIIYRSSREKYPYREFLPVDEEQIILNDERYYFNTQILKDLNIQIVVLTPEEFYRGYFDIIRKYFVFLIVCMLFFYLLRGFWGKKYFYDPLNTFLKTTEKDRMSEVSLQSPYQEWIAFEEAYNSARTALSQSQDALSQSSQELEKAINQLIQAEKLATLGQLVPTVAHEIVNSVSFVSTTQHNIIHKLNELESFFNTLIGNDPKVAKISGQVKKQIEDIRKPIMDVKTTTQSILNITQALRKASRFDEEPVENVSLKNIIKECLLILSGKTKHHSIETHFSDIPLITCFPSQIGQVVTNLIVNAVDAIDEAIMNHDGTIQGFKGKVILTLLVEDRDEVEGICLQVEDNGQGIPAEIRDKALEAFFTTKPTGLSTGLGLAICYKIVQKHQGTLKISDSELLRGACLEVWLPVKALTIRPDP
ncbi:sensor histidine kinase [Litoribacillus peritrichatus]|uniref:histidine kinase n=1 Tax=Litoribacillus peritrichatus TaxID=718191 RepID=A0ABP7MDA8_9GAMM